MKTIILVCLVICTIGGILIGYKLGYDAGARSCPIKYAVCENGTCVLSEMPPQGIVK